MSQPLVTIAIPTYNRALYLGQAIESALLQTYHNIEVLVADNASTDNTGEVVKQFNDPRVQYHRHEENRGLVYNWNFCLKQARGEFFLMLSDDDILERNAVEWLQSQFQDPSVVMAYSRVMYINENSEPIKNFIFRFAPEIESGHDFIINSYKGKRDWLPCAALYRTDAAVALGGYPPVGAFTDGVLCYSLAKDGIVCCNPQPLARYRVHDQNISKPSKYTLLSRLDTIQWSGVSNSPLFEYRDIIRKFCVYSINHIAFNAAKFGNNDLFCFAADMLRWISPGWVQELIIFLYRISCIRYIVSLMIAFKKKICLAIYRLYINNAQKVLQR